MKSVLSDFMERPISLVAVLGCEAEIQLEQEALDHLLVKFGLIP